MRFYCRNEHQRAPYAIRPPKEAIFPCVTLAHDNWDDYNYKTTYQLGYYNIQGKLAFHGELKILQKDNLETNLKARFMRLNKSFCSLGQSIEYYNALKQLDEPIYRQILVALNDVVFNKKIADEFEQTEGFKKSLLRFSEAEKAYKESTILFDATQAPVTKNFLFEFSCRVAGAAENHKIEFDFSEDETALNRTTILIGKNGTGKTQVLANFANAMSGRQQDAGSFSPGRPSFSKVIAISYSIFDEFDRPERSRNFSYKYCGIRKKNTLLSLDEIKQKLAKTIEEIEGQKRLPEWKKVLGEIFSDVIDFDQLFTTLKAGSFSTFNHLSAGQRILVLVMTEVIANIAEESVLLFDEPEMHLHPDVISAITRALNILLEEFNSYAIVATHSPIILQEIPARYVRVFRRQDNYPIVSSLGIESFGENLTTITDEVFETSESSNNYRRHLKKLAEKYTYEQILDLFDGNLSLNAKAYLGAIFSDKADF